MKKSLQAVVRSYSTKSRMAAPDLNPGSKVPTGPSAKQDATNPQKDFVDRLGMSDQLPAGATKGQASDVISHGLGQGSGNEGSGAAPDDTPGSTIPTGPSAKQDATRNQQAYAERLGTSVPQGATKGEASEIIQGAQKS